MGWRGHHSSKNGLYHNLIMPRFSTNEFFYYVVGNLRFCLNIYSFSDHIPSLNSSSIGNRFSNLQFAFQRSILNLEIRDICVQIKELENFILFLTNKIASIFPAHVYNRFFQFESSKISRHFEENKFKCKKKLDSLINSLKCNNKTVSNSKLN